LEQDTVTGKRRCILRSLPYKPTKWCCIKWNSHWRSL